MPPDPIWPQLLLQVILIICSAFFTAAEVAVVSLNDAAVRKQAEAGDRKARRRLKILEMPARVLSTIQIGATLAGFLGAAFAAVHFAERLARQLAEGHGFALFSPDALKSAMVVLITVLVAFFTLLFGVLVPRRAAMSRPERAAGLAGGVLAALAAIMRPIIWLLAVCTSGVLRLMRIDPNAVNEEVSEEGIRMMVDIGEEKGAIESSEKELIENIFEFNNMTAEDVMVHRTDMVMLWAEDTAGEIVKTIEESGLSRFPVYEEDADDIVGILSTRDYLLNARRPAPKPIQELIRPAYFVPESVRADILFRDMQSKKIHIAIVVDEYGGTSGLVTMEDLLEEIVGNIYDEFDPLDEQEILQLEENLWRVSGVADLEDLADALGIELPEQEEYDTLGGLVFAHLSVIPEDGSRMELETSGLKIQVEEFADRRVEWALVSKLPPQAEEAEKKT